MELGSEEVGYNRRSMRGALAEPGDARGPPFANSIQGGLEDGANRQHGLRDIVQRHPD